jgi:hypothetical protein
MADYTLQDTINWAQTFIEFSPLTAGTNNEPAISVANMIVSTITNAPLTWGWNRAEYDALVLQGKPNPEQDYTVPITDFGFLEKVTLINAAGTYAFNVTDVYNTGALGVSVSAPAEPKGVSVHMVNYGTDVTLRFIAIPDQNYTSVITYQKLIPDMDALDDPWPIPSQYKDIFNNLFAAEAYQAVDDDQQAQRYRMRGVAALLAKAEGLNEMQRNSVLAQFLVRSGQAQSMQLKTTQGNQARGV